MSSPRRNPNNTQTLVAETLVAETLKPEALVAEALVAETLKSKTRNPKNRLPPQDPGGGRGASGLVGSPQPPYFPCHFPALSLARSLSELVVLL